jgi:hypothetical protein
MRYVFGGHDQVDKAVERLRNVLERDLKVGVRQQIEEAISTLEDIGPQEEVVAQVLEQITVRAGAGQVEVTYTLGDGERMTVRAASGQLVVRPLVANEITVEAT